MRRLTMVLVVLVLSGMVAAPVFAGPGYGNRFNCPYGYGPGASGGNLTSEQIEQLEKLAKTYIDEIGELRDTLWEKRRQLDAVMVVSEPDATKAMALQKEISDIKAALSQKRLEYQLNVKKVAPEVGFVPTPGFGWGRRGYDMMGPGYGMMGPGYGMMGPGYGMMGPGYGMMHRGYGQNRPQREYPATPWEWQGRYGRHMMGWDHDYGYGPCWY